MIWSLGWGSPVGLLFVGLFILMVRGGRWSRRDRGAELDAGRAAEFDELRGRVSELERDRDRLTELEERLDFTERMLAKPTDVRRTEH